MANDFVEQLKNKQELDYFNQEVLCKKLYGPNVINDQRPSMYNETLKKIMCPAYWDTIYCWPPTPANSTIVVGCPSYVTGFIESLNMFNCFSFSNPRNEWSKLIKDSRESLVVPNDFFKQILEIFSNTKTKHKVLEVLFANDVGEVLHFSSEDILEIFLNTKTKHKVLKVFFTNDVGEMLLFGSEDANIVGEKHEPKRTTRLAKLGSNSVLTNQAIHEPQLNVGITKSLVEGDSGSYLGLGRFNVP
ncbi:unnamed protein product [Brassicogethes aeneus]|uniref:G-protein coupled receptors family 2 profile 1 domain-containing protein n=1 Tax=Brassicogethes aeneus TaxID=1431903 RepID=A0A9P0ATF7_BRAAE|nr:unnamed protein product [Brassicogethes aeneus]